MSGYFSRLAIRSGVTGQRGKSKSAQWASQVKPQSQFGLSGLEVEQVNYRKPEKKAPGLLPKESLQQPDVSADRKQSPDSFVQPISPFSTDVNSSPSPSAVIFTDKEQTDSGSSALSFSSTGGQNKKQDNASHRTAKTNDNDLLSSNVKKNSSAENPVTNTIDEIRQAHESGNENQQAVEIKDDDSEEPITPLEYVEKTIPDKSLGDTQDKTPSVVFVQNQTPMEQIARPPEKVINSYQVKQVINKEPDAETNPSWVYDVISNGGEMQSGARKKQDNTSSVDVRIGNITIDVQQNITTPKTDRVKPSVSSHSSSRTEDASSLDVSLRRHYIRGF